MFATEPSLLTFGQNTGKSKDMWKTPCGGFVTFNFTIIVLLYLYWSLYAVATGDKDNYEIIDEPLLPGSLGNLTFQDMRVLPVVHFDYLASSVYLNPEHSAFKQNIFVALEQTKRFENGTK